MAHVQRSPPARVQCDPVDRQLLLSIVSTLSRALSVPLFCKIRLLDELDDTLAFVKQLQDAGCALLAVHGRYRGSPLRRRDGPAHLDQIALIKKQLAVPVITNGNVRCAAELVESLQITGADGAMTAEGALDDPAWVPTMIEIRGWCTWEGRADEGLTAEQTKVFVDEAKTQRVQPHGYGQRGQRAGQAGGELVDRFGCQRNDHVGVETWNENDIQARGEPGGEGSASAPSSRL